MIQRTRVSDDPAQRDLATLSRTRLSKLNLALGQSSLSGVLAMFEHEVLARPQVLAMALADNDLSQARHHSRVLARAALNLGASALAAAARRIEDALNCPTCGRANALRQLAGLRSAAERTLTDLRPLAA